LFSFAVDGFSPSAIVLPVSAAEVEEVVRFAASEELAIISCGSRSKLEIGMPPARYDIALDMRGLCQIAHYDAGDLTLSVDAGIPLRQLQQTLAHKQQFLPLAVPCFETSTVGGAVASGIDSVLRQLWCRVRFPDRFRVCGRHWQPLQKWPGSSERSIGARSAQTADGIAGNVVGHHAPEFPDVSPGASVQRVLGEFYNIRGCAYVRQTHPGDRIEIFQPGDAQPGNRDNPCGGPAGSAEHRSAGSGAGPVVCLCIM
jgi:FAD binding domain